jgi:hypothetical protein
MKKWSVLVIFSLLLPWGCAPSPVNNTPTPDVTEFAQQTSAAQTQAVENEQATQAEATAQTVAGTATGVANYRATATQKAIAYATSRAESTQNAHATATQQAQGMLAVVQGLYSEGTISRTTGKYIAVGDFVESWAQLRWYRYWNTGFTPRDFVLTADIEWDSASTTADWWASGCGFVFRAQDVDNHYRAYLGLDGNVYFNRYYKGIYSRLGHSYYGPLDVPNGSAKVMLVVDGPTFTFYVNGKKVHSRSDTGMTSGGLAMTLASGTNKGAGTTCKITNIELWQLE